MTAPKNPAIWDDAMCLATEIEVAVRSFPRYHKYTLGTDLRRQAGLVCRSRTQPNSVFP